MFFPDFTANGLGGIFHANFDSEMTPEMTILYKYMGGFMFVVGCMLSGVRWNPSNGIMSCLGCFVAGGMIAHTTFVTLDNFVLVPRLFYGYAAVLVLAGLHVKFNCNPAIKAAEDTKKK